MVLAGNKAKKPFIGQPYHKNNSSSSNEVANYQVTKLHKKLLFTVEKTKQLR